MHLLVSVQPWTIHKSSSRLSMVKGQTSSPNPLTATRLVIPDGWKTTGGDNPHIFLVYDDGPYSRIRMLVICSDTALHLQRNIKQLQDRLFTFCSSHIGSWYQITVRYTKGHWTHNLV